MASGLTRKASLFFSYVKETLNMNRIPLLISCLLLFLLACNAFTPTAVEPTAAPGLIVPAITTPTIQAAGTTTAVPTVTPFTLGTEPTVVPTFGGLYFARQPTLPGQTAFAAGTEEVFAIWQYANLTEGDLVERRWFKDGQVWLTREEAWQATVYGVSGTRVDVSVYDFEGSGLEPGHYALQLFINGQAQIRAEFDILPPGEAVITLSQSSETRIAQVWNGRRLMVVGRDGRERQLAQVEGEIVELNWLPDGRHLLFVELDRSEQIANSSIGLKHALWQVDADTGAVTQLGSFAEDLHGMKIAPDGRYVAFTTGTEYGDACFVDRHLRVMALSDRYQRLGLYERADFAGAPSSTIHWIYLDWENKTSWDNHKTLRVAFAVTCLEPSQATPAELRLPGYYLLDMETFTAVRTGDLP